jgi:hypothetical protein
MNIVAHEDDDLLFMNPDVLHDIQQERCVRTVFVTAGDAGKGSAYWRQRSVGAQDAYARMAQTPSAWTHSDAGVDGHRIEVYTLQGHPHISLVFLRLPDGDYFGDGFPTNGSQSLAKLRDKRIPTITSVDGINAYTRENLEDVIFSLLSAYGPEQIRIQDVAVQAYADHSDHSAVALMVKKIDSRYTFRHRLTSYRDYVDVFESQNVFGADLEAKQRAFSDYAGFDDEIGDYTSFANIYHHYLKRQYIRLETILPGNMRGP